MMTQDKPLIFISYAHADEPEKPAAGEIKWLSFVTGYLRPAVKHGAVELWTDQLMPGGEDVDPEIERKLCNCDIFILLVSRYSLSSDYVVDKEIPLIRKRQAKGEDVQFYPLVLTPTPKIALDLVRDKNLRPRDGKPFSEFSLNEQYRHMNDASDEILEIATKIRARRSTTTDKASTISLFLSYRHLDDEPPPDNPSGRFVQQLHRELVWELRQLGAPDAALWFDRANILPGDAWSNVIHNVINKADLFVILLSRDYLASEWCKRELSNIADRLESFDEKHRWARILRIDKNRITNDEVPDILRDAEAVRFYNIDQNANEEKEYFSRGRILDERKYDEAVQETAVEIYRRMKVIRSS
jgi:TIR domain